MIPFQAQKVINETGYLCFRILAPHLITLTMQRRLCHDWPSSLSAPLVKVAFDKLAVDKSDQKTLFDNQLAKAGLDAGEMKVGAYIS